MQKIFSTLLCFALVFCCIFLSCISVSAVSDDGNIEVINILDYSLPNNGSITQVSIPRSDPYAMFSCPFHYGAYFYDLIIEVPEVPTSVYIRGGSGRLSPLTFKNISGITYRCYGTSSIPFDTASIGVQVETSGSSDRYSVNFLKFDVYTYVNSGVGDLGEMRVTSRFETSPWYSMSKAGSSITHHFAVPSPIDDTAEYKINFSSVNWRNFDYIDFSFTVNALSIHSISAYIFSSFSNGSDNVTYLPFDISFVQGSSFDKSEFISSGSMTTVPAGCPYNIIMRVYIPPQARSQGSFYIDVNGDYYDGLDYVTLGNVTGFYYVSMPDPYLVKLDQVRQSIIDSMSSTPGQNAAAGSALDSSTQIKDNISSDIDILNGFTPPDINSMDTALDPGSILNAGGMTLFNTMLSGVVNNKLILALMLSGAALAHFSFCYFGKKV